MIYLIGLITIFLVYLCGSIPTGYLVARLYGIDVMASGSGRTGGTNVLRSAGTTAAGLTVFGDVMKGLVPIFILHTLAPHVVPYWVVTLAAPAAVLGHNYSIFLGFRGGVGAGTTVGVLGGINFWIGLSATICALIALVISRYASILSTTVAISGLFILTLFAVLGFGRVPYDYILSGILMTGLMLYALRENYARILAGTERKIGQKTENVVRISH